VIKFLSNILFLPSISLLILLTLQRVWISVEVWATSDGSISRTLTHASDSPGVDEGTSGLRRYVTLSRQIDPIIPVDQSLSLKKIYRL